MTMTWRYVTGILAAAVVVGVLLVATSFRVEDWLRSRNQKAQMPAYTTDVGTLAHIVHVTEGFAGSAMVVAAILGFVTLVRQGLSSGYVAALLGTIPAVLLTSATGKSRQRRAGASHRCGRRLLSALPRRRPPDTRIAGMRTR